MVLAITNIAPNDSIVDGGAAVTITGTDFAQNVRVMFGDVKATSVTRVDATTLQVVAPKQALAGNVAVRVTNDPGYFSTGPTVTRPGFAYYAKITAIAPAQVRTTGGTNLTITGVGFPVGVELDIDGIRAHNVVRVSATTITCQTRQHDVGEVQVFALNPADPAGFAFPLWYCAPLVMSLSPAKGTVAGGIDVTIHGKYFHDANVDVHFDGQASPAVNVVSPTELVARTPAHLAGVVDVRVTNPLRPLIGAAGLLPDIPAVPAVEAELAAAFEYCGPEVTSIEPKQGPAAGGTDVTIRGRGFLALAHNGVQVGGVPATNVVLVDGNTITARTAAAAAGPGAASVQNNNGDALATLANAFTFVAQPTITRVEPARGPAGTPITIEGRDFVQGARVRIGGVMARQVQVVSSTAITTTAPPHALGAVLVEIRNDGGAIGSMAGAYTYTALSLEPARGLPAGAEVVTLTLPGLVRDDAVITFDGANVARAGGLGLRVTTAAHAAGPVDVVVGDQTLAGGFVFSPITSITPKAGPAGTTVTIRGAGFDHTTTVAFDGAGAGVVTVISGNEITVVSPVHADGPVDVVLGGGGADTFAAGYTYQAAATVTAIAPATATQAGGTPITITGTGFVRGAAVTIDGNAVGGATVVSPTTITGTVPAIVAALVYPQVDVRVTNPGAAAAAVGVDLFQYRAVPTVTAVANPAQGPIGGGRAITVTGQDFIDKALVVVDGVEVADTVFVDAATLRARVPAHTAGAVGVAVHNPEDPAAGPARAATFTYVADPHTATGENHAHFLLDGEAFFEIMRQLFEHVRQAPRDPKGLTYVRLAYWMIEADVTLGDRTFHGQPNHSLLTYIEQVARAGHHVEVIMWRPKKHEQYVGEGKGVYEANRGFADKMYALDVSLAAVEGAGRARVYFEAYEGETGASNHQKIAIFSLAGQRQVIVGGLNLSNGYFASNDHQFPDPTRTSWHDAALYLCGPVTDDVEKEWKRRWDRTRTLEEDWLVNQLGGDGEFLARDFAFFEDTVVRQRAIATETNTTLQDPQGANHTITIALTRSVGTTRMPRLRDKVIERINAAEDSIYFENYHFGDPDLVQAIVARHHARALAGANLAVVVVVPRPMGPSSSYMTRRAWLHMVLSFVDGTTNTPYCTEVIYDLGAGAGIERVLRANCGVNWTVTDCYDRASPLTHKWLEADTLRFQDGVNPAVTVRFSQILAVDGALHFYSPCYYDGASLSTVYTHSKIASFDDRWLVVGSANWSYRSMQYDGEISAFVDDGPTAAGAVQDLLMHYNSALGGALALDAVEAQALLNIGAAPVNEFALYPLDLFEPGNVGVPHLGLQRTPPPALEVTSVLDFVKNPAEPNYTWL